MWFFFSMWMWDFVQISVFHWYVTISSPACCLKSGCLHEMKQDWYIVAKGGKWMLSQDNFRSCFFTCKSTTLHWNIANREKMWRNCPYFYTFSLSVLHNGWGKWKLWLGWLGAADEWTMVCLSSSFSSAALEWWLRQMELGDCLNTCCKLSSPRSWLIVNNLIQSKAGAAVEVVTPSAIPNPAASACQRARDAWPSAEENKKILSWLIWDDWSNHLHSPDSSQ